MDDETIKMDVEDFPDTEFLTAIIVKALVQILKPDEGIVIHQDDEAFIVYWDSADKQLKVMQDDEYEEIEHGRLIWMHYEGSQAPEPGFDEKIYCDPNSETKH